MLASLTNRRWFFLGLATAILIGVWLWLWLFWSLPPAVCAYNRVCLGMTPEQVEAAIGEAPSNCKVCKHTEGSGGRIIRMLPFVGKMRRVSSILYSDVPDEQPFDGWQWDDGLWL